MRVGKCQHNFSQTAHHVHFANDMMFLFKSTRVQNSGLSQQGSSSRWRSPRAAQQITWDVSFKASVLSLDEVSWLGWWHELRVLALQRTWPRSCGLPFPPHLHLPFAQHQTAGIRDPAAAAAHPWTPWWSLLVV